MVRAEAPAGLRLLSRPLTYVDVFTRRRLAGNQLAVVHDADGLDDATMQAFAQETRLSETTFVQAADGADYRNRIFCPTHEMDFAGHPSVGTAVAVARRRGLTRASFVQETPAGRQPLEVAQVDDDVWTASVVTEPVALGAVVEREVCAAALGLAVDDLSPSLAPQVATVGNPIVLVPVAGPAVLERLAPTYAGVVALLEATTAGGGVVYACWCDGADADARGFFADHGGVLGEDPATGSAAAPLAGFLHARTGVRGVRVTQGVLMGRPSELRCAVADDGRVTLSGDVVVVAEGMLLV